MQSAYDEVRRVVRSALHLWLLAALPEGQDRLRSSLRQRGERAVGFVLTEEHVPSVQRSELATPRDAAYTNVISAPRRVGRGIPRPQRTRNTTFDEKGHWMMAVWMSPLHQHCFMTGGLPN